MKNNRKLTSTQYFCSLPDMSREFYLRDIYDMLLRIYDYRQARRILSRIFYYPEIKLSEIHTELISCLVNNCQLDEKVLSLRYKNSVEK